MINTLALHRLRPPPVKAQRHIKGPHKTKRKKKGNTETLCGAQNPTVTHHLEKKKKKEGLYPRDKLCWGKSIG
jgi:hypothetical protein